MAHNNVEVEIKVALSKNRFEEIKRKIKKICKFVKTSYHIDNYYTPIYKSFLKPRYPYEWLTIRQRDGKTFLNYKHWYPEGAKYTTHCDEYQTEVFDAKLLAKILKAVRFNKFISIEKKRLIFIYKNKLEVALDVVKGLGCFLEIESLRDFGGTNKTREEILKFARFLGIYETKTIPGGYAAELMRRKGLRK